jgi:hypothetical protein
MFTYGDALGAFRNQFGIEKDGIIKGFHMMYIVAFCYGWLTAKGVPCDLIVLEDRLENSDQIAK